METLEAGQVGKAADVIVNAAALQQLPKSSLLDGNRCGHLSRPMDK